MVGKKKKGEACVLYCEGCRWSTELPLASAQDSVVIPCAHCGQPLYWHRCARCGLCYAGTSQPSCPICDDDSLDDLPSD